MSPLSLRRYRAERLLREEFEGLRAKVLATVRRRLGAMGVILDAGDLEACYAQAWQGLYAAVLAGQEIANPTGWLVLVTFRRAIEDHRSSHVERRAVDVEADEQGLEPDLASQMDDHRRLRQVFEALRERLSERECQAASLCYLQGLSRAEAAASMGISETRMRKLMDGDGSGRSGVAAKMGELLSIIRTGGWCEERSSLMRGFAFGILDPEGERYQLALIHQRECPACRAYVASLRGLAAILPPVFLRGGIGAGVAGAGAGVGTGALSAGSTAGVSGASGGWMLAGGSLGAKLAGCLVALGIGAGCLALVTAQRHDAPHLRAHVALAGGPRPLVDATVFSPMSSTTPIRRLIAFSHLAAVHGAHRPPTHSEGRRVKTPSTSTHPRVPSDTLLAAEAEFGPEHPHSLAEFTQQAPAEVRTPATPVRVAPPAAQIQQPPANRPEGEFGFESRGG
jgi:DNA-directed RNA polymerase specialized sigma24 family protein